jgi:hypothetical protein
MIKIDGCESAIYPDGSVRINIADGGYLCLDYSDIKFLYNEMTMKLELKGLKRKLPQLEEMSGTEY